MTLKEMEEQGVTVFTLDERSPITVKEGVSVLFGNDGFLFPICCKGLSPKELLFFNKGAINIELVIKDDLIIFLLDIDGVIEDGEVYFTMHLTDYKNIDMSPIKDGMGYLCNLVLIDERYQIVRGTRRISLQHDFSKKFRQAALKQLDKEFNKFEHIRKIDLAMDENSISDLRKLAISKSSHKRKI